MVPQLTSKVDNLRPAFGFDDISLAPGTDTADPSDVDLSQNFCGIPLSVPIIASAMDAVVSPTTAGLLHKLGSLACINLEGLWFRYDDPLPHFAAISAATKGGRPGVVRETLRGASQRIVDRAANRRNSRQRFARNDCGNAAGDRQVWRCHH